MILSPVPAAFVRPSRRHVEEAVKPEPKGSFSTFRLGGSGGPCGFDSHALLAPMVGLLEKGSYDETG